jgi:hypothetical protein
MITKFLAAATMATLLLAGAANAQSAADLLQKGIHAQETVDDPDGAIRIFRQVVASPNTNKQLAAQAQYQLVLCLLQKGDRPGASQELQLLEKNFADQPDLIDKARKPIPGANAFLLAAWLEPPTPASSGLLIDKRQGVQNERKWLAKNDLGENLLGIN